MSCCIRCARSGLIERDCREIDESIANGEAILLRAKMQLGLVDIGTGDEEEDTVFKAETVRQAWKLRNEAMLKKARDVTPGR